MSVIAFIQARLGSTRLPGKVLLPLGGKSVLERVIERVRKASTVDDIVIVTTLKKDDVQIVKLCANRGDLVFCGSEEDVLDRFYQAAKILEPHHIVRITADCPVIDPKVVDAVVERHLAGGADYSSNTLVERFPDGLDVEVMTFGALQRAWREASLASEREHVTLYMRTHPELFRLESLVGERDLSAFRWTLDTEKDYRFLSALYDELGGEDECFGMEAILDLLAKRQDLLALNSGIVRNEGLLKSLREDRTMEGRESMAVVPGKRSLKKSEALWARAEKSILSGTQLYSKGPATHIRGVSPIYIERGKDAHVWDPDGNEYIDYDMGLGPILLGYCYGPVDRAVMEQLERGMGFSLVSPPEVEYAELCQKHIPSAGKVRFLKTGSSATEAAIRIARAYTGRKHVIRGEYHGWHEWTAAGESVRQGGILPESRECVHRFEYNDLEEAEKLFKRYEGQVAALITEPVVIESPKAGFLEGLKSLCEEHGALLVFDEVVDGFRFSIGGAQAFFGITPDLSTFGKAAANGMPLSIVAGRRDIMDAVDNSIFISTTFGGETLSLAAGIAVMKELESGVVTKRIWSVGERLQRETNAIATRLGVAIELKGYHCRMSFDYRDQEGRHDWLYNSIFMQECVKRGVLLGWSVLPCFTHSDADIDKTLEVFEDAMKVYKEALGSKDPSTFMEGEQLKIVLG